jgi:hemerythrin-like domain-containing protein
MAMKITEALLAEHVVFHNAFDHLERALPKLQRLSEVKAMAALLESLLEAHSRVEDELILKPLECCFEQLGQTETIHQEHEEIDANLRSIRKCRDVRSARRLLQAAVVASRQHFDKEERLIFPMAEKTLKSKTLAELGLRWMQERKAITG